MPLIYIIVEMKFREFLLASLSLTISSVYAIGGELPIIDDVIKVSAGYSYSATLKFSYSHILTALYNKIDILTCSIDASTNEPTLYQLITTIEPTLVTQYEQVIEGLSPGKICVQVCGKSTYRTAKKCSKIYTFDNNILHKLVPTAGKQKNTYNNQDDILTSTRIIPTSISATVIGYELAIRWRYLHHYKPAFSLSIRLIDEVDRQITFHNGARELVLGPGTNFTLIRLPSSHFKYKHIHILLCSTPPASNTEVEYKEKNCPTPLVIDNDVISYNREAGVSSITVDRGIANVKLNKDISKHTNAIYVECIWSDNRDDERNPEQTFKQEIKLGNKQLRSIPITSLQLHSAYSCLLHIVRGETYSLFADKPFVFNTPDL